MKKNNAKFRWTFTGILFAIGCISLGSAAYLVENETNLGLSDGLVQVRFVNDTNATTNEMLVPPGTIVKVNTSTVPGYSYVSSKEDAVVENKVIFGDFVVPENVDEIKCTAFAPIVDSDSYVSLSEYVQGGTPDHLAVNLTGGTTTLESTLFSPSTEERRGLNEKYVFLDVEDNFVLSKPLSFVIGGEPSTDTNQRNLNQGAAPATTNAFQHVTEANHLITVVLQSDLTIGSGGSLALEATTGRKSTGFSGNVISGSYTALDLNGHTITLQNGATLRQFGLLTDFSYDKSGQIIVDNGAHLSGGLVVEDFNGGTVTVGSYLVNSAPFFLFSMPYLEATVDVLYGGNFGGDVSLYAQGIYGSTEIPLFGSSDTHMVEIENTSSHVVRSVKGRHRVDSTQTNNSVNFWKPYLVDYREEFALIGPGDSTSESFRVNPMVLPLLMSANIPLLGDVEINAEVSFAEMDFPIAPWMHISLEDGAALNFGNSFGFLPGSSLDVDSTSKIIFSSRNNIEATITASIWTKTMTFNSLPYLKAYDFMPPQPYYSMAYFASFNSNYANWDSVVEPAFFNFEGSMELDSNNTPSNMGIGGYTHMSQASREFIASLSPNTFNTTPIGIMRVGAIGVTELGTWMINVASNTPPHVAVNAMYNIAPLSVDGYIVKDLASLGVNANTDYYPDEKWTYDCVDSLAKRYSGEILTGIQFFLVDSSYDQNFSSQWTNNPSGSWVDASRLSDGNWGELNLSNYQRSYDSELGVNMIPFVHYGDTYYARFGGTFVPMLTKLFIAFETNRRQTRTHTQTRSGIFADWKNDTYTDWSSSVISTNGITSISSLNTNTSSLTAEPIFTELNCYENLNVTRFTRMSDDSVDSDNANPFMNATNSSMYSLSSQLNSQGVSLNVPNASGLESAEIKEGNWSLNGLSERSRTETRSTASAQSSGHENGYSYFRFDATRASWRVLWVDGTR